MSLVKWFRKNMKMLMAIFVIGILFAFIGGTQVLELLSQEQPRDEATFANGETITNMDRRTAANELEMLRRLQVPLFVQQQGLHGALLAQLIFSDGQADPRIIDALGRMVRQGELHTSEKQLLDAFSDEGAVKPVYWILLKHEARSAGMGVRQEMVADLLAQIAQGRGQSYAQLMQQMRTSYGLSEEGVIKVLGDLLSVLQFSQLSTHTSDVTLAQIQHQSSWANETLEAQFVKLEADAFLDALDPNAGLDLEAQFKAFRQFSAGETSDENEYGFGYRLPDRIRVDYLAVKLEDLKAIVGQPTQDEKEGFYSNNAETLFTRQESSDPNDPNAPLVDVTDPFAKVVANIHDRLITEKVVAKATTILQEARADSRIQVTQEQLETLTDEQRASLADAYTELADALSQKYQVPVHAGQTGLISRSDALGDAILNRWSLSGPLGQPIPVTPVLFDCAPLESNNLQLLGLSKPHLFETLGPLNDAYTRPDGDVTGQSMAIVRVVEIVPSTTPETLETTYENSGVTLDAPLEAKTVSLKDQVYEDARALQAYRLAQAEAEAFMASIKEVGWESAVAQLNGTIKDKTGKDPNDPDPVRVQQQALNRIPADQQELYANLLRRSPGGASFLQQTLGESKVAEAIYERIPETEDQATDVPFLIDSPAQQAIYCFNDVTVKRFSLQDFRKNQGTQIQRAERVAAQSLVPIHFDPQNILSRMNYQPIEDETDDNAEDGSE